MKEPIGELRRQVETTTDSRTTFRIASAGVQPLGEEGRGEGMEQDHLPIALPALDRMRLAPEDNVLDLGCGAAGWPG